MPRIALELEFDGHGFAGSQAQTGLRTVQGTLAAALSDLAGAPVVVRPASRLDQGVSAEAFTVDAWMPGLPGEHQPEPLRNLGLALAGALPDDLSVRRIAVVEDTWNAQHAARTKTYRYTVTVRGTKPVLRPRCWWVRQLDHPERLQTLANQLLGNKDLRLFANLRHDGSDDDLRERTIFSADWQPGLAGDLIFRISGTGFLYKQIRGFVGAMVHLAQGRRDLAEFSALIAGDTSIKRLGNIAPPAGLMLERVTYDPEPPWRTL